MRIPNSIRWMLATVLILAMSSAAFAGVFVSVNFGPPPLPVYVQPPCPAPGYMWTPGYWAYGPDGYYWVPGTWVLAPQPGFLWTPGYWGFAGGVYLWHAGYWGPRVGFYGGINYGFGYTGVGFAGGYWRGGQFFYNRNVTNVNIVNVHNVYNTTVINNNTTVNRVAYNGGPGGLTARPTAAEQAAAREQHIAATSAQVQHETMARNNRDLLASVNHGKPSIAATARPSDFKGAAVSASRAGGPYRAPEANNNAPRANSVSRPTGNSPVENGRNNATPMRSSVPRPPSSFGQTNNSARNENNSTTHSNVPRPSSASRPSSNYGQSGSRPEPTYHAQNVPRPQSTPRPQSSSRSEQSYRQPSHSTVSRPQSQPRPEAAPQHESQPRQESHPGGESRPAEPHGGRAGR
ncbi:MAG TPA: hypothetical protein VMB18_15190 [Terriglobales bacterium]|nr:hypothetical protein [Terriglobales bacterium]